MPEEANKDSKPQESAQTKSGQEKKSSGAPNKTLLIVIVLIILLALIAAGGYYVQQQFFQTAAEKAVETATGGSADISQDGDKVTIETEEGKLTFGDSEVPSSFPSDISIYSGSKVIGSTDTSGGVSVVLETSDSAKQVAEFYKSDLESNGWEVTSTTDVSGTTSYSAEKGNKNVFISIAPVEGGTTNISITVTNK